MILKNRREKKDKKMNPLIGIILLLVSIILLIVTTPFGLLYGFIYSIYKKGFRGLGEYCLKIAISIDQLGNVLMQHLLNLLWLKKGAYRFGNRDETISSALGRNKKLALLNGFGRSIDRFLDKLDPDHSLNSIDYYIEPNGQIIDKLGWIYIENGRILCTRSQNRAKYYIPGGRRALGESDAVALTREIREELSVELLTDTFSQVGIFEARADGQTPEILVRMTCYNAAFYGSILPNSEIKEAVWLRYADRNMVSEAGKLVFDFLREKELLA